MSQVVVEAREPKSLALSSSGCDEALLGPPREAFPRTEAGAASFSSCTHAQNLALVAAKKGEARDDTPTATLVGR